MPPKSHLHIGLNGRFFDQNWRPVSQEITFAAEHGFQSIQFQGKENGLTPDHLGTSFEAVREALTNNQITAVMEIALPVNEYGKTASGLTPVEVLEANLPAIRSLPCKYVHWHLAPLSRSQKQLPEHNLLSQFAQGVSIALEHEFVFGFENNSPRLNFLSTPASCAALLDAVDHLGLVWDVNHTIPEHLPGFQDLIPKMTALHISDTPLPEVNHHLPLGQGNINFKKLTKELSNKNFQGPAVLEIGGLPKSGGYGKDTDEALIGSLHTLQVASGVRQPA